MAEPCFDKTRSPEKLQAAVRQGSGLRRERSLDPLPHAPLRGPGRLRLNTSITLATLPGSS